MLLNRRLCKLRKAIRLGRVYTPRTKEIREERMRRKLHWRLVQAIYYRLKALGYQSPGRHAANGRRNAVRRAKYAAALAAVGKQVGYSRLTPEQRRQKERIRERNREHRKRGRVSTDIIQRLKTLQRSRCAVCGGRLKQFHLDHIEPLSRGGPHHDHNVQLLCPPCNLRKAAKDPIQFMQEMGRLL